MLFLLLLAFVSCAESKISPLSNVTLYLVYPKTGVMLNKGCESVNCPTSYIPASSICKSCFVKNEAVFMINFTSHTTFPYCIFYSKLDSKRNDRDAIFSLYVWDTVEALRLNKYVSGEDYYYVTNKINSIGNVANNTIYLPLRLGYLNSD